MSIRRASELLRAFLVTLALLSSASSASAGAIPAQPKTATLAFQTASGVLSPAGAAETLGAATILTTTVYSWAQTWSGTKNASAANVVADSAGNIYVVGQFAGTVDFDPAGPNASATYTSTYGTYDAFLTKFNAAGVFQWARTWGGGSANDTACYNSGCGRDAANGVAVDAADNVYVSGLYQNTVDFGGGFVSISNAPDGSNNIFVSKFAPDGTLQWVRTWGGTAGGESYNVAVDKARGYVYVQGDWSTSPDTGTVDFNPAGGHDYHANHGFYDAFLSSWDTNGTFRWARTWGGEGYDDGPGVAVDGAGSLYVGGMYASRNINFDPAGGSAGLNHPAHVSPSVLLQLRNVDVFLSKFDVNGTFQWVRTWGGLDVDDAGGNVLVDQAGEVYITGRFGCQSCDFNEKPPSPSPADLHTSTSNSLDAFLSKFDANGNYRWTRTWGGNGWDSGTGLAVDPANNIYATGFYSDTVNFDPLGAGDMHTSNNNSRDASLTKFTSAGVFQWAKTWGGSGQEDSFGLVADTAGNVFVVGDFMGSVNFNPGNGIDSHVAANGNGAFLSKFGMVGIVLTATVYLPLVGR